MTCGFLVYMAEDFSCDKMHKNSIQYSLFIEDVVKRVADYYNNFIIGEQGLYSEIACTLQKIKEYNPAISYEEVANNYLHALVNRCEYIGVFCFGKADDYLNAFLKIIDDLDMYYDVFLF